MKFRFTKFGKNKLPNKNLNLVEEYNTYKPLPTDHHIMMMLGNNSTIKSQVKENPFMLQV